VTPLWKLPVSTEAVTADSQEFSETWKLWKDVNPRISPCDLKLRRFLKIRFQKDNLANAFEIKFVCSIVDNGLNPDD
jgi:hypothetical protein